MTIIIYGKPRGKKRVGRAKDWHAYKPDQDREYEEQVKLAYIAAGGKLIPAGTPVAIEITAWYAIPKSARGALRERMTRGEVVPVTKPDWDNIGKLLSDALNGVAWHDDAQITQATVHKVYGITPMVRVEIKEA